MKIKILALRRIYAALGSKGLMITGMKINYSFILSEEYRPPEYKTSYVNGFRCGAIK